MNVPLTFEERRRRLATYFGQPNDFRFFVGVPVNDPRDWDESFSMERDQLWGADLRAYPIVEVKAWIVCYARTMEMADAEGLFGRLPPGVADIHRTEAQMPAFTRRDLDDGLRFVQIEFEPSPTHTGNPKYYKTTLANGAGERIRCLAFGAYALAGGAFRLGNVTGALYSAEQFQDWYAVRSSGWIEPGESVCDSTNYGSRCFWVYYFGTESGRKFHVGKEVKPPGLWGRVKGAWSGA